MLNEPSLEFVWVGDDAVDPLEQAQTLEILVGAGIKTREEARADLGLAPAGGGAGKAQAGPPVVKRSTTRALLGKYNPHHDERGLFATADNVDINSQEIRSLNDGEVLKLKFPKK